MKNNITNILNSDFGICNWNTIPRWEVNFEVAPKEDKSNYSRMNYSHRNNERRQTQQKKNLGTNVNTIPLTKLNKLLNDISSKDLKLRQITHDMKQEIQALKTKLMHRIKLAQVKQSLHMALMHQMLSRLPKTGYMHSGHQARSPLQRNMNSMKKSFQHGERLLHEQSAILSDMKQTLERLADKHGSWTDKFADYKVENFTIIDSYGVVHNSPTQYVDTQGRVHNTLLQYMTACGTIHDSLTLSPVSARHHCRFVGHTRQRCGSPRRKHSLTRDV